MTQTKRYKGDRTGKEFCQHFGDTQSRYVGLAPDFRWEVKCWFGGRLYSGAGATAAQAYRVVADQLEGYFTEEGWRS